MKFGRKNNDVVKKTESAKSPKSKDKNKTKASVSGTFLHSWAWQPAALVLLGVALLVLVLEVIVLSPNEQRAREAENIHAVTLAQRLINARIQERVAALQFASSENLAVLTFADLVALHEFSVSELRNVRNMHPDLSFASVDILRRAAEQKKILVEGFFHQQKWFYQLALVANSGRVYLAIFDASPLSSALRVPGDFPPGQLALVTGSENALRDVLSVGDGNQANQVVMPTRIPQWSIRYAPADLSRFSIDRVVPGVAVAVAGVVLALLVWLLVRSRMNSIKNALLQATKAMRGVISGDGKKKTKLPFAELNSMVEAVTQAAGQRLQVQSAKSQASTEEAGKAAQSADDAPLFEDDLLDLDVLSEAEMTADPLQQDVNDENVAGAMVEEVEQLDIDVPQSIFRAYDIRGIVDDTLNESVVELIGKALATEALAQGQQTLCVGYDGRLSSRDYCEAITRGIISTGADAIIIGQVPTPVLYFATHHHNTGSGVMITGSHNPSNYNGFKMMIAGNTLSGDDIQKLYNRIVLQDFVSGQGARSDQPVDRDYLNTILDDIAVAAPLKVVVDAGNGVAGDLAPVLIEELGCEVIPLHCEVDGTFPNHHPDPGKPENLQDLIAAVKEHDADIGLAFDGDGDRVGVVTNAGKIIWPDRLLMLFAKDVVARNPGADIIYDVKCSRRLSSLITGYGGRPIMWKTGHSLIKAKMKETGALLAGEMSGHVFFKERWFGFDDGLYSAARLLEILGVDDRPSDEVFADFPEDISTPEINITVTDESKFTIVDKLCALKDQFGDASVSTIDGLRADYPNGWGLCRASNTTPVLVLRFEADDETALEGIKSSFKQVLQQVDPSLNLDF